MQFQLILPSNSSEVYHGLQLTRSPPPFRGYSALITFFRTALLCVRVLEIKGEHKALAPRQRSSSRATHTLPQRGIVRSLFARPPHSSCSLPPSPTHRPPEPERSATKYVVLRIFFHQQFLKMRLKLHCKSLLLKGQIENRFLLLLTFSV
jgi:hypothetical protein